ncbi:class I SAM-dependent methyltransferase [Thiococcus pfennigii]|uniref:class I SAM-dependent methyltransferase n=1 Tax=Thiococcus pfennigii TaxID=1057 RepID=UPI0019071663|nr:class I SAM-dependent methyltransferase [Thiococcus pfennigii]
MSDPTYFDGWSTDLYGEDLLFQRTIHRLTGGIVRGAVLDLGCGSRVHYDTSRAERWLGLDVSQAMLDDLRFFGGPPPCRVETRRASCLDIELPAASFDTVCAIFLLHHLGQDSTRRSRARVVALLAKAHRLLRPGGTLLIAENAARALEWPYHLAYAPLYRWFHRHRAVELPHFWTRRQLLAMAREAGFGEAVLAEIPIRERIANPMTGIALPPALIDRLQRMTLLVLERPA